MTSTTHEKTAEPIDHTVMAAVNAKAFFQHAKHMFSSGTTFLSELLQNAQRAGATKINFDLSEETKTLTVYDDGVGIKDFSALVTMCESNWSDDIMAHDKPFGMGLFSVFHAAKVVSFHSNGSALTVLSQDIENCVPMKVSPSDRCSKGTAIEMNLINDDLLQTSFYYVGGYPEVRTALHHRLRELVRGFGIQVFFNGIELESPHDASNLNWAQTKIGRVSCDFVSGGGKLSDRPPIMYLQGLPIGEKKDFSAGDLARVVIHLDSEKFVARVPDRAQLYDHDAQMKIIEAVTGELQRNHLKHLKTVLTGEDFAARHTEHCFYLGMPELLNDVLFMPESAFLEVHEVTTDTNGLREYTLPVEDGTKVLSKADFVAGKKTVWLDLPDSTNDHGLSVLMLQVACAKGILTLAQRYHPDHWIYSVSHAALDLRFKFTIEAPAPVPTEVFLDEPYSYVKIITAEKIDVSVRSIGNPDYPDYLLNCNSLNWLGVPSSLPENEWLHGNSDSDEALTCYVTQSATIDDGIVEALVDFYDENGYVDEAEQTAHENAFADALSKARGAGFSDLLKSALSRTQVEFRNLPADSMCVVVPGDYQASVLCDITDDAFWETFAASQYASSQRLDIAQHAAKLKADFIKAAHSLTAAKDAA